MDTFITVLQWPSCRRSFTVLTGSPAAPCPEPEKISAKDVNPTKVHPITSHEGPEGE